MQYNVAFMDTPPPPSNGGGQVAICLDYLESGLEETLGVRPLPSDGGQILHADPQHLAYEGLRTLYIRFLLISCPRWLSSLFPYWACKCLVFLKTFLYYSRIFVLPSQSIYVGLLSTKSNSCVLLPVGFNPSPPCWLPFVFACSPVLL